MSQSGSPFQKASKPENSPEKESLLAHKRTLEEIKQQIKPGTDLRRISAKDIEMFKGDLNRIAAEVENIKHQPTIKKLLGSTDAVSTKLNETISELDAALDVHDQLSVGLSMAERTDARREINKCLNNSRILLEQTLKQFKLT